MRNIVYQGIDNIYREVLIRETFRVFAVTKSNIGRRISKLRRTNLLIVFTKIDTVFLGPEKGIKRGV